MDLGCTLIACTERDASAVALVDGSTRLTYEQMLERASSIAVGLGERGLRPGETVVVVLQNRLEMALLHWACQLGGFVVTPINWRSTADDLSFVLDNANAKALIFEDATAPAIAACERALQVPRWRVATEIAASTQSAEEGVEAFDALLAHRAYIEPVASESSVSVMLYTSGTTGAPKGVPRSHRAERAAAVAHVAQNNYRYRECTLGVMPLYHTMGVRSLLSSALLNGCFVCQPRFNPAHAIELIEREQISNLYLVPTLYHDLLQSAEFSRRRVASVRKLGFAGAPMTDGLLKRLVEAFDPELFVNHYGSSEIYTFTICPDAPAKPGSAGKAGINQQIRLVRIASQDPNAHVSVGEEGEIIASLASDEAFSGYWRRPDADRKSIHQGWYFTGDIGVRDPDGDLFVTGRVDDMIISGGENIMPVEIESVLSLHPRVAEVAVVGLADERLGQRVTAFIARNAPVEASELNQHCLESALADYKRPRDYIFVKTIPKSPVGKILRRMLHSGEFETE